MMGINFATFKTFATPRTARLEMHLFSWDSQVVNKNETNSSLKLKVREYVAMKRMHLHITFKYLFCLKVALCSFFGTRGNKYEWRELASI